VLASVLTAAGIDLGRAIELREEAMAIATASERPFSAAASLAGLGLAHALLGDNARAVEALDRALAEQRAMRSASEMVWTHQWRAITALQAGDLATARLHYAESLADALEAGGVNSAPCSLDGVAGIAALRRRPELAARLLGAAEALRESIGIIVQPAERPLRDRTLSAVEAQLRPDALQAAWHAGRSLSARQAVAEAEAFARGDDGYGLSHEYGA
jgi:tetratricopeptide (TPR) repeat protein